MVWRFRKNGIADRRYTSVDLSVRMKLFLGGEKHDLQILRVCRQKCGNQSGSKSCLSSRCSFKFVNLSGLGVVDVWMTENGETAFIFDLTLLITDIDDVSGRSEISCRRSKR